MCARKWMLILVLLERKAILNRGVIVREAVTRVRKILLPIKRTLHSSVVTGRILVSTNSTKSAYFVTFVLFIVMQLKSEHKKR